MAKILVVYYSAYGHVEQMALAVADGARSVAGSEVNLKRVPELVPEDGERLRLPHAARRPGNHDHILSSTR